MVTQAFKLRLEFPHSGAYGLMSVARTLMSAVPRLVSALFL